MARRLVTAGVLLLGLVAARAEDRTKQILRATLTASAGGRRRELTCTARFECGNATQARRPSAAALAFRRLRGLLV